MPPFPIPTSKSKLKKFTHLFNIISSTIILLLVGLILVGFTARITLADGPVEEQIQAADLNAASITGANPWIWILGIVSRSKIAPLQFRQIA